MKIIDYAIIFVIILMPIVLLVTINLNSQIKAQNVEVYYKNLIDSAISDASQEMKELENDDIEIDYGYDGEESKKVSINAEHAINTFLNSLFFNLGIKGNKQAEALLLDYIPAALVIDYNGIHMYSVETFSYIDKNGQKRTVNEHILKPKKYYAYSYDLEKYCEDGNSIESCNAANVKTRIKDGSHYNIIFTLSDYITFVEKKENGDYSTYSRYAQDMLEKLFPSVSIFSGAYSPSKIEVIQRQNELLERLNEIKKDLIINMVSNELSYAVSKHNAFAKSLGIEYDFQFSKDVVQDWYSTVQDVGVMSFVQGVALGNNQYLNHYAFGGGQLNYTQKYLVTGGTKNTYGYDKLYHKTSKCPVYISPQTKKDLKPLYYASKYKAATAGYYPCPVCISLSSTINENNKDTIPKIIIDGPYKSDDKENKNKITSTTVGENIKFIVTYKKEANSLDNTVSLTKDKVILNYFGNNARIEEVPKTVEDEALSNEKKYYVFIDGIVKNKIVNGIYEEIGKNDPPVDENHTDYRKKYITILGTSVTDANGKNAKNADSDTFKIDDIKSAPKIKIDGPSMKTVKDGGTIEYTIKFVNAGKDAKIELNNKITLDGFNGNITIIKNSEIDYKVRVSNITNIDSKIINKSITIAGSAIIDSIGNIAETMNSDTFIIK